MSSYEEMFNLFCSRYLQALMFTLLKTFCFDFVTLSHAELEASNHLIVNNI